MSQDISLSLLASSISSRDTHLFVNIINDVWGPQINQAQGYVPLTAEIMKERLNSGHAFFAAYAQPDKDQLEYLIAKYPQYDFAGEIPCGIMETIQLKTGGDINKTKLTYDELTNKGHWSRIKDETDTIIFVDITANSSFPVKGTGKKILEAGKRYVDNNPYLKLALTYSPDDDGSRWLHLNYMGAELSDIVIPQARPWYKIKDVRFTIYRKP